MISRNLHTSEKNYDDVLTRGGCANEARTLVVRRVYRQLERDTTRARTKQTDTHTHTYSSLHTTPRSKLRINLTNGGGY
jgi:hypothetical protein